MNKDSKVTLEQVEATIVKEEVVTLGVKTTAVVLTLRNGFEVVATSAAVSAENYDPVLGEVIARKRAIDKVWELEGYVLQTMLASYGQNQVAE